MTASPPRRRRSCTRSRCTHEKLGRSHWSGSRRGDNLGDRTGGESSGGATDADPTGRDADDAAPQLLEGMALQDMHHRILHRRSALISELEDDDSRMIARQGCGAGKPRSSVISIRPACVAACATSASGCPTRPSSWTVSISCPHARSSASTRRGIFSSSLIFTRPEWAPLPHVSAWDIPRGSPGPTVLRPGCRGRRSREYECRECRPDHGRWWGQAWSGRAGSWHSVPPRDRAGILPGRIR
jgi:hypothetical protein